MPKLYYLEGEYPHAGEPNFNSWTCECCGKPLGCGDTIYTDESGNIYGCSNCLIAKDADTYFEEMGANNE